MEPYIGQIIPAGFNFAPSGWAFCNGQLLSIAEYTALFSLIGTIYGGDGQTTFALPDLRARIPLHQGQGNGLSSYDIGQNGGVESVTLINGQIGHTHPTMGKNAAGDKNIAGGLSFANPAGGSGVASEFVNSSPDTALQGIGVTGGVSLPHDNIQPYLVLNYCIALEGIYPSRS